MSRGHISSDSGQRLLSLDARLSDRDRRIVRLVAQLKLVSGGQVRRAFFEPAGPSGGNGRSDGQLARRALLRLTRLGLLLRLERRIGGLKAGSDGFCYRLAPGGQRLLAFWEGHETRGRRLPDPGERFVQHRLAVSELAVRLAEAVRGGGLELVTFQAEPDSWRQFLAAGALGAVLKPDAFVRLAVGDFELWWFVEVDLGTVGGAARAAQAAAYRAYWQSGAAGEVMPRVLWLCPDEGRLARARRAIRPQAEPVGLFMLATDSQAIDRLRSDGSHDSSTERGEEARR
jgi:hypothetical protein